MGPDHWTWSAPRRARCEGEGPPRGGMVVGRFKDASVLTEWRGGAIEYSSEREKKKAEAMARQISHFVRDDEAAIGLFLGRHGRSWHVIAVDMLAPEC